MEYKINTVLPIQFERVNNPPYIDDSRWQVYKVWIAHDGENYNGSYFDVEVLKKMGAKLAGVSVVGYISLNSMNEKDFNGHEERLVIQDGEISIEYLGRAYGCVLENNDWQIEQKEHEDGSIRNYLTCKCIIWKMFKDAIEIFERDGKKAHSMELEESSIQGKFEKDGYFHFTDAKIRALCILGEGIQPAMSNSIIEKFSHVDFNKQVKELLEELNESIKKFSNQTSQLEEVDNNIDFSKKEVGGVNEKLELLKKYNLTLEDVSFDIDSLSLEEIENKIKEEFNQDDKIVVEFSATYRQKREALSNALKSKTQKDNDGNIIYEEYYWLEDFDDEYIYVEKCVWTPNDVVRKYGRFTYTFDEQTLDVMFTGEFEEMILVWLTLEENKKLQEERKNLISEFENLKNEFEEYKNNHSTPNEEVEKLQQFKNETIAKQRREAEENLFSQFDQELKGIKEYEELKENAGDFDLNALEKECFAILGKKNAIFSIKSAKTDKVKFELNRTYEEKDKDDYNELFEKYL